MANKVAIPEAQLGPAEKLLDLVLSSSAHVNQFARIFRECS